MKSFTYIITDKEGIHARPAGIVVAIAKEQDCKISIANEGKTVDAKRIFAVMSLGAKMGDEVEVICEGEDEEKAAEKMLEAFRENL